MIRYKVGKFDCGPVHVEPGDTFNMSLKERLPDDSVFRETKVVEEITIKRTITHWVMFYHPEIGFGGMFGGADIIDRVDDVFVDPVFVPECDSLFGDCPDESE